MVDNDINLKQIYSRIQIIRTHAEELQQLSESFPALNRNLERILASLKMLELNICDPVELNSEK